MRYREYTRYFCRHCHEECINHRETPEASTKQCRGCWRLPSLDDARHADEIVVEDAPSTDRREVRR